MTKNVRKRHVSPRRIRSYTYPNEAEPGYFANRISEGALALVSCMGTVTFFLLVLTL